MTLRGAFTNSSFIGAQLNRMRYSESENRNTEICLPSKEAKLQSGALSLVEIVEILCCDWLNLTMLAPICQNNIPQGMHFAPFGVLLML